MSVTSDPFKDLGRPVEAVPDTVEVEDVFDLDRVIAEREVKPAFVFRFDGETYSLPARPDMRAAALFADAQLRQGFEVLLGSAQWERLVASEATFDDQAFTAMYEAYQAHIGEDLGESKASTRSSKSTAKK